MTDQLLGLIIKAGYDADYAGAGEEIVLECPLCDDHKKRLYISRRDFLWICHNCGEKGNIYRLLEKVLHYDPVKAGWIARNLLGHAKKRELIVNEREDVVLDDKEIDLPEGFMLLTSPDAVMQGRFWRYLTRRNVEPALVRGERMGFVLGGYYAYRIIVPIYRDEKRMGWIARDITGQADKKVLTAPGMKASQVLYNLDRVKETGRTEVGLVEGVFDAMTLPYDLVASLGAKLSPIQRRLLREAGISCVILLWDSDETGIKGMQKTVPQLLGAGFQVKIAILPEGEDPSSAGAAAVAKALADATPVTMSARHQIRRLVQIKLNSFKETDKEKIK